MGPKILRGAIEVRFSRVPILMFDADIERGADNREWNNKVLGKCAIKKGGHFSRGRPFKPENENQYYFPIVLDLPDN